MLRIIFDTLYLPGATWQGGNPGPITPFLGAVNGGKERRRVSGRRNGRRKRRI